MTVDDPCSTTGGTCKWKIKWKFEVTCTRLFAKAHVYGAESRARGFARVILNGETEQDSKSASAEYGPTGEEMSEEDQEHASNGGISVDHSGHKLSVTEEDEKGILAHMSCTVPTNSFFEVENFAYGEGEAIYSDATWTKINVELVSGTCGG